MKQPKTTVYRSRAVPADHPLAQPSHNGYAKAYEHRLVLFNKIGGGEHKCHWCKKTIAWDGPKSSRIVADHLDADTRNNEPENLVPACWRCNFTRATRTDFLTHCRYGHEFTTTNTYHRPDGGGRQCKECSRKSCKARYHRRRQRELSNRGDIEMRSNVRVLSS